MFKIIMFVKKRPDLTQEEFIQAWKLHSEKVIKLKDTLQIKDYRKTFPLTTQGQSITQRKTLGFDFDAMGELWYESKDDFIRARESEQGKQALALLKEDETRFVDLANSVMWLGEEESIF